MAERLADHWTTLLPTHHREALADSFDWLADAFLDEYDEIASGRVALSESLLGSNLPRMQSARYDLAFAKRFFACLLTVGWKLAQIDPQEPLLSGSVRSQGSPASQAAAQASRRVLSHLVGPGGSRRARALDHRTP